MFSYQEKKKIVWCLTNTCPFPKIDQNQPKRLATARFTDGPPLFTISVNSNVA